MLSITSLSIICPTKVADTRPYWCSRKRDQALEDLPAISLNLRQPRLGDDPGVRHYEAKLIGAYGSDAVIALNQALIGLGLYEPDSNPFAIRMFGPNSPNLSPHPTLEQRLFWSSAHEIFTLRQDCRVSTISYQQRKAQPWSEEIAA